MGKSNRKVHAGQYQQRVGLLDYEEPPRADVAARLAERDAWAALDDRSLAAILMGDPPLFRSAYGRRSLSAAVTAFSHVCPTASAGARANTEAAPSDHAAINSR